MLRAVYEGSLNRALLHSSGACWYFAVWSDSTVLWANCPPIMRAPRWHHKPVRGSPTVVHLLGGETPGTLSDRQRRGLEDTPERQVALVTFSCRRWRPDKAQRLGTRDQLGRARSGCKAGCEGQRSFHTGPPAPVSNMEHKLAKALFAAFTMASAATRVMSPQRPVEWWPHDGRKAASGCPAASTHTRMAIETFSSTFDPSSC